MEESVVLDLVAWAAPGHNILPVEVDGCRARNPEKYLYHPHRRGLVVGILSVAVEGGSEHHTGPSCHTSSSGRYCNPAVLHTVAAAAAVDSGNHILQPGLAVAVA